MSTVRQMATILGTAAVMSFATVPVRADCPSSLLQAGNSLPGSQVPGPSGTYHDAGGSGDLWFFNWGDSLRYNLIVGNGNGGHMEVRGDFKVLGAPLGSTVPLLLETRVSGDMSTLNGVDGCGGECGQQLADLFVGGVRLASHAWTVGGYGYPGFCTSSFHESYLVAAQVVAGEVFQIQQNVGAADGYVTVYGTAHFGSSLWFRNLPPGSFIVACDGDTAANVLAVGGGTSHGLSLDAVWPNPSRGEIHAACALPRGGPVVLRLFDAAGRVTETRIWDAPAATRREVTLGGRLAPGAYFLQISQGANSTTRAVTIVR